MMDTPQALFITFVAQSIVVFASNAGKFGGMTNVEVGEEYPTLFMPARWAFAIWGVIYTLETVAFGNLYLAELASLEMVQLVPDGAIAHLVVANACQLLWALAFTFEHLLASTLFMAGLAYSLTAAALGLDGGPLHVLAVATSLHAGWVCAALLLNLNLAAVQLHVHDTVTRQAVDLTLVFGSLYAAFGRGPRGRRISKALVGRRSLDARRGKDRFAQASAPPSRSRATRPCRSPSPGPSPASPRRRPPRRSAPSTPAPR